VESFDAALSPAQLLQMAASAELRSEHPLGKAIVAHYRATCDAPLAEHDINPVMGALVHNAGSVAVIINSALLLNWRRRGAERTEQPSP
jgi:cation transport ATPase